MPVRNIIFDLGNVIIKWDYKSILQTVFPDQDFAILYKQMRSGWIDWNLGQINQWQLMELYHREIGLDREKLTELFDLVMTSQVFIPGAYQLLDDLNKANVPLYSITDNTYEIIEYHRTHSKFLHLFIDVVVSADLGILKPDPAIYLELLSRNNLQADECIFIDDIEANVVGARAVGIYAILFEGTDQTISMLRDQGFVFGDDDVS